MNGMDAAEWAPEFALAMARTLWGAVLVGDPCQHVSDIYKLMRDPRPGDPVVVMAAINAEASKRLGRLISVERDPQGDCFWKWLIEHADGSRTNWENVSVLRLPRDAYEVETRADHARNGCTCSAYKRAQCGFYCVLAAWDDERYRWVRARFTADRRQL